MLIFNPDIFSRASDSSIQLCIDTSTFISQVPQTQPFPLVLQACLSTTSISGSSLSFTQSPSTWESLSTLPCLYSVPQSFTMSCRFHLLNILQVYLSSLFSLWLPSWDHHLSLSPQLMTASELVSYLQFLPCQCYFPLYCHCD